MSDAPFESNREEEKDPIDDDWNNRVLCRDENCIGVIGPDGRCKECGKPYEESSAPETQEVQTDTGAEDDVDRDVDRNEEPAKEDDWESRTLCSDESCIGVIGPDGRCKECGKVYQG